MTGGDSINVYSLGGEVVRTTELPQAFRKSYRPDMIRRAVTTERANRRQPYGPSKMAGMRHAVSTWGKGRGVARVQRLSQGRAGAESPPNVGGRRAHPPVPEKQWDKRMNRKERAMARLSALSATADPDVVRNRGHLFDEDLSLPLVVEDDIEQIGRTSEVMEALDSLGVGDDLDRAKMGKKIRAGRGKMRGRKFRRPLSLLIVISDPDAPLRRAAANLPGVEAVPVNMLNTGLLAPGGDPGRLLLVSESAFGEMGGW